MAVQTWFPATVIRIVEETYNVKRLFFKVEGDTAFEHIAGQFVMLNLPINSKITTRSYSIASAPHGNNEFELCIVHKPDGLGTQYIWDFVREGTVIPVSKALGKFALPENIDRELCFICTGTGVAPFIAMLQHLIEDGQADVKITLISGSRYQQDILYLEELSALASRFIHFRNIFVVSRQENWQGEKGYVHAVYEKLYAEKQDAYFYLCGWHNMVHEARQKLEAMGYDKEYVRFESYD